MLAVFWCRHRDIFCFVGIDIVLSTKPLSNGYNGQIEVGYIIYQESNILIDNSDQKIIVI